MKNKIIFIPGWMDTVANRVDFPGLDIWLKDIDIEERIDAEYVVGHSAGANWALLNWEKNKNTKLILFGPGISQRTLFDWLIRLIKFWFTEGTKINRERIKTLRHPIRALSLIIKLLRIDLMKIIYSVPEKDIIIIRGKDDKYLFDEKTANELKSSGIRTIKLDGVGHNWHEKVDEEIKKIINN